MPMYIKNNKIRKEELFCFGTSMVLLESQSLLNDTTINWLNTQRDL